MDILTFVYFYGLIVLGDASCNLPFSKRCKRNDPKFSECWSSTLKEIPQYLKNGIPDLNVPAIDPWRSDEKYAIHGDTYSMIHGYMEHAGTENFEVISSTISLTANIILLKLRFPKLDHRCTTVASGKLLNFQFMGIEGCNEATADVTIEFVLKGKRVKEDGKEYIDFNKTDVIVQGKYKNQRFYDFVTGGSEGNKNFSLIAEKAEIILEPIYNECVRVSLGINIAEVIKNIYRQCPLDILHPLK